MNNTTSDNKSRLLVIELTILLVFFLVASIVCVNLFVKANKTAEEARVLNQAVVETTSIAETLKSTNGNLSKAGRYIASASAYQVDGKVLTIYYDENMNPVDPSACTYTAIVEKNKSKKLRNYSILISYKATSHKIYCLEFSAIKRGGKK